MDTSLRGYRPGSPDMTTDSNRASDVPAATALARSAGVPLRLPASSRIAAVVLIDVVPRARLWGLSRIVRGRAGIGSPAGLRFAKVLGSGANGGFVLQPSTTHHGLFLVFDDDASAEAFIARSAVMAAYRERARELFSVKLRPLSSRGRWSGVAPFDIARTSLGQIDAGAIDTRPSDRGAAPSRTPWGETVASTRPCSDREPPIAALTRASIRLAAAPAFWRRAPAAQADLEQAPGCLVAAGLGEAPLLRQATFSIWDNTAAMDAYARSGAHLDAIKAAREERYFTEDLFARFVPYHARGTWKGRVVDLGG